MAVLSDYVSGTITLTNGSVDFTGTGTGWQLAQIREGDTIYDLPGGHPAAVILSITSNVAGILTRAWAGPDLVDVPYRIFIKSDGSRATSQSAMLREQLGNGNIQALAGLTGSNQQFAMFTGPGAMTTISKAELTSGANYDVQVDTPADRDAYDGQAEGFSVLISDMGDGRSAITSRVTATTGIWSDPAYVTGPIGATPDVTVGTVTTGAPGTEAEVTANPVTGGVELDFTIPAGEGFSAKGAYSGATAYAKGDVVRDAGSSWIALQATTGNAPPTLPTTSNAYWELMAQKGNDGAGTGDVVGPAGGVADGDLVAFDGGTGKLVKKAAGVTNVQLATMANATVKGRNTAGTGAPEDVTMAQLLALLKTVGAYAKDNILGTVSQSAGVPTGAIVERGSNANGQYVRYADGTQICWRTDAFSGSVSSAYGNWFVSASQPNRDYPAAFSATPFTVCQPIGDAPGFKLAGVDSTGFTTSAWPRIFLVDGVTRASATATVLLLAVGRWF